MLMLWCAVFRVYLLVFGRNNDALRLFCGSACRRENKARLGRVGSAGVVALAGRDSRRGGLAFGIGFSGWVKKAGVLSVRAAAFAGADDLSGANHTIGTRRLDI